MQPERIWIMTHHLYTYSATTPTDEYFNHPTAFYYFDLTALPLKHNSLIIKSEKVVTDMAGQKEMRVSAWHHQLRYTVHYNAHCSVWAMIFSMTLALTHPSCFYTFTVVSLLSVCSERNYKVLLSRSPEADQGQARSCTDSGDSSVCTCASVCMCVGAGGGRRWEGHLRTLTAPVAWATTAGVEEASRRSIVAELNPCDRRRRGGRRIGCSALGPNDISPDV